MLKNWTGKSNLVFISPLLIKGQNITETYTDVTLLKGYSVQDLDILALVVCQPRPEMPCVWHAGWHAGSLF